MNSCNSPSLVKIHVSVCDIGAKIAVLKGTGYCRCQNKVVAEAVPISSDCFRMLEWSPEKQEKGVYWNGNLGC